MDEDRLRFPEFDPDPETRRLLYANVIQDQLGEFGELETDDPGMEVNGPRLPGYRVMLEAFADSSDDLEAADLCAVLAVPFSGRE